MWPLQLFESQQDLLHIPICINECTCNGKKNVIWLLEVHALQEIAILLGMACYQHLSMFVYPLINSMYLQIALHLCMCDMCASFIIFSLICFLPTRLCCKWGCKNARRHQKKGLSITVKGWLLATIHWTSHLYT